MQFKAEIPLYFNSFILLMATFFSYSTFGAFNGISIYKLSHYLFMSSFDVSGFSPPYFWDKMPSSKKQLL